MTIKTVLIFKVAGKYDRVKVIREQVQFSMKTNVKFCSKATCVYLSNCTADFFDSLN